MQTKNYKDFFSTKQTRIIVRTNCLHLPKKCYDPCLFNKAEIFVIFKCDLLALALLRTEIFFLLALRQNLDKNQNLDKQILLPNKSSQKFHTKNSSPKQSFQKISKIPKKSKKFKTISQKIPKILKISNSLYITLGGLKPFRVCFYLKYKKWFFIA